MPRAAARAAARAHSFAAHHRRHSSSSCRRSSSSSRASTSSSVPTRTQACVLLLGPRDDDLAACALKLADVAAAHDLRVFTLSHDDVDGLTRDGRELRLARGDGDAYALRGSGEDAAVVALDATDGILAQLGYECVLCLVVGGREVCLGEDGRGVALDDAPIAPPSRERPPCARRSRRRRRRRRSSRARARSSNS